MDKFNFKKIPVLNDYKDWYDKALYDFDKFKQSRGVYELTDCLLTLNALPEWIRNSDNVDLHLKNIVVEKIEIMQGKNNFIFDETKLHEVDQQLRFIRIFCNHSKHAVSKEKFPKIEMAAMLPAMFPITFDYIKIGNLVFPAEPIIKSVIDFWSQYINKEI
ncbi:hypothetical protein [Flavobacterium filum]|uniref:hypothetical protein n=1 Tax=Flavobacterium filum TaxID=370974 RepID=UPI00042394FE|nr:hypothetical protein [Flavobacterium filum]